MTQKKSPGPKSKQIDMISLAKVVLRRWGLLSLVLGGILAGGAAAITIYVWEPVYDAKQSVQVMESREYTDIVMDGPSKTDPKKIMAHIRTEWLLGLLLNNEEIRKTQPDISLSKLRKMVRYESDGGDLYLIIARHRSPKFAQLVAEKLAIEFRDFHSRDREERLTALSKELDEEIEEEVTIKKNIADRLKKLNEERMVSESGDENPIDPDGVYYAEVLKDLYNERLVLEQNKTQRKRLMESMENVDDEFDDLDESKLIDAINLSPQMVQMDGQIQSLENQMMDKADLGGNHPDIRSLQRQIAQIKQRRKEYFDKQLAISKEPWINTRTQAINQEIETLEMVIVSSEMKIDRYSKLIDQLESQLVRVNEQDFQFKQKLVEQERSFAKLDDWYAQRSLIKSKMMALDPVVLRDEEVELPTQPVERYPLKMLGLASFAGLIFPFACAFSLELRLRRISSPEQIPKQISSALLGEIAELPTRSGRKDMLSSKRGTRQLRLYEESVDNLSAMLSHSANHDHSILAVTSAASNEGKTTLSTQLAISSAKSNSGRTLIIDADIRSPSLHRLFGFSSDEGLVDVLSDAVSFEDAICETDIDGLDLLPAGKLRANPRRYFAGNNWSNLLAQARELYDHIVVDTPPVLAASESLSISRSCDLCLLCMLRDVSRSDGVQLAHDRLTNADVNVIGCAFGGVPQSEYAIRYGNYGYNMS